MSYYYDNEIDFGKYVDYVNNAIIGQYDAHGSHGIGFLVFCNNRMFTVHADHVMTSIISDRFSEEFRSLLKEIADVSLKNDKLTNINVTCCVKAIENLIIKRYIGKLADAYNSFIDFGLAVEIDEVFDIAIIEIINNARETLHADEKYIII